MHNALFFSFFFLFLFRDTGFFCVSLKPVLKFPLRPRRPQTHRGPRPSPTQVLGLKALTTSAQ